MTAQWAEVSYLCLLCEEGTCLSTSLPLHDLDEDWLQILRIDAPHKPKLVLLIFRGSVSLPMTER